MKASFISEKRLLGSAAKVFRNKRKKILKRRNSKMK